MSLFSFSFFTAAKGQTNTLESVRIAFVADEFFCTALFSFFTLRTIGWCYYRTQNYFNTVLLAPDDPEPILCCGLIKSEGFLNIAVVFICPHADGAS